MDSLKIDLELKYKSAVFTIILVVISLALYWWLADSFEIMEALGIAGAIVGLGTLSYTAMSLHSVIEHNQSMFLRSEERHNDLLALEKKKVSAQLISKWHSPDMVKLTTKGYEIRSAASQMDGKQIAEFLTKAENKEHHQSLICIFNFFEEVALLVETGLAEETILKKFFGDLFKTYYLCFKSFIEFKQKEMKSTDVLSSFVNLAGKWNIPS